MIIGIDISQLAYRNIGVSNYLENLIFEMTKKKNHEFIFFFSSLRRKVPISIRKLVNSNNNIKLKRFRLPPVALHLLWNKLHKVPLENFVGNVDIFISSDWTEPPAKKALKATILYDLIVYKYPDETASKIVAVQKEKLKWVKKESDIIFCISEATKKDAEDILGLEINKLKVIYPGLTL